jgi:aspartyl-tRNA(Asn)/glutamyl-tRNA(Gln) amidotransferase subunit A
MTALDADPIVAAGATGLAPLFATGAQTPTAVCDHYLARIARYDNTLHSLVHIDPAGARQAAAASTARWRADAPLSLLDGVPMVVKANIAVCGWPFHAGIAAYRNRLATEDAACIAALRRAGVVLLGLANMHEAAFGGTTDNPAFGRTENPWRIGTTAGGSSGGSAAAVAAGLCAAALGTDTLGSVRIPSAYCGIVGHKPATGTLSSAGVIPLYHPFDTIGIHARSAPDCAAILAALTGTPASQEEPTFPARLAILRTEGQVDIHPAQLAALNAAAHHAQTLGATMGDLYLPELDYGRLRRHALLLIEIEAAQTHAAALATDPEGFSPAFRSMLAWATARPPDQRASAAQHLSQTARHLRTLFAPFTVILACTTPQPAFPWTAPVPANQADLTTLASLTGLAAAAIPAGLCKGLPLSVQIIAPADSICLRAAHGLSSSAHIASGLEQTGIM